MAIPDLLTRLKAEATRLPPVTRPLAFLVVPAVILHMLFVRTPDVAPTPLVPVELTATSDAVRTATARGPSVETAKALIEKVPEFQEEKRGAVPKRLATGDESRYPILNALKSVEMVSVTRDESLAMSDYKVELTPQARATLGADLTEDIFNYVITIARRKMEGVWTVQPPPHPELEASLRDTAVVQFAWRWVGANRVGNMMRIGTGTTTTGNAYLRKNDSAWEVVKVDFHDQSPDYMSAP